jgi:DivIVA domain-containing protein
MLTPDEVVHKKFTQTQFRRGYSEMEVDDFLDVVAADLRSLLVINADQTAEVLSLREENDRLRTAVPVSQEQVLQATVEPMSVIPVTVDALAILNLAQKTYDAHVADGETLVSQARERASGIVAQAIEERDVLNARIAELQQVRQDAYNGLKGYLEYQVKSLETIHQESE